MEIWRTLHPRRILTAPGAISVHGSVSSGLEPVPSGPELSAQPTWPLRTRSNQRKITSVIENARIILPQTAEN